MFSEKEKSHKLVKVIGLACLLLLVIVTNTIRAAEPADNIPIQESVTPAAGLVVPYAGATIPEGWLLCDGRSLERAAYPELFAAIGTLYGEGDTPGQTFQLPDYRGNFLRGLGGSSAGLGQLQSGATKLPTMTFTTSTAGGHTHNLKTELPPVGGGNVDRILVGRGGSSWTSGLSGGAGNHSHTVTISGGDPETRPINMAVNWIISTGTGSAVVTVDAAIISSYPGATIPEGWLLCDGRSLERAAYPELFAAIGTLYGEGDTPGQTFQLPDYRGSFLRGLGGSSASLGQLQSGATKLPTMTFTTNEAGEHTHALKTELPPVGGDSIDRILIGHGQSSWTPGLSGGVGNHSHTVTISGGDPETRPVNMAVNWIISTGISSPMQVLITAYAGETIPEGWLVCDGRSLERAAYPELFAAIGTLYGEGDTLGKTFQLPDYRGSFLRGLGGSSAGLGQLQSGATKLPTVTFTTSMAGDHTHNLKTELPPVGGDNVDRILVGRGQSSWTSGLSGGAGEHSHTVTISGGDPETRPVNMAVNWIIRATGETVVTDGLVLWNKLGSEFEVLNSEVGPDLDFYTGGGGVDVPGTPDYVAGKFGNAVTLSGTYFSTARVHNLVLDNLPAYINPEQGTIELWYRQTAPPIPYDYGIYRMFDGAYGLNSGMVFDVGDSLNQLRFGLLFGGATLRQVTYDLANIPNNEWVHLMGVWDRNGIDGSTDAIRLYVKCTPVAAVSENDWGTTVGLRADIAGGNDANIAGKFMVDNLIIYNQAVTSCSGYDGSPLSLQFTGHHIAANYRSNPSRIKPADMDGDGDVDLVSAATYWGSGDLSWWENDGLGSFVEHSISQDANFWGAFPVDMDGDEDVDILTYLGYNEGSDYRITLWVNDGNQNFAPVDIASNYDLFLLTYPGDMNGDGDMDAVVYSRTGEMSWYENDGSLNFTKHIIDSSFGSGANALNVEDVDGDGDKDVLCGTYTTGELAWWENNGAGNFSKHTISSNFGNASGDLTVPDIDNDGDPDILATNGYKLSWFENDGSQNFTEHVLSNKGWDSAIAVDLDNDDDQDIVAMEMQLGLASWGENDGAGNFTYHLLRDGNYSGAASPVAADLDGDNDLDLIGLAYWQKAISWEESDKYP